MELIRKELEQFRVSDSETAGQAVERLNRVVEYFNQNKERIIEHIREKCQENDEEFEDEAFYVSNWNSLEKTTKPFSLEKVSEINLHEQEERFGIKLPQSYKDFVLKYGYIGFGKANENLGQMFSLKPMLELVPEQYGFDLLDWEEQLAESAVYHFRSKAQMDDNDSMLIALNDEELAHQLGKNAIDKIANLYAFGFADEDIDSDPEYHYYLFDFNRVNVNTGEVPVVTFSGDDSLTLHKSQTTKYFNEHMSWAVDRKINLIFEEFFWGY